MPIDLACYTTGDLKLTTHHRFASGDAYFATLSREWSDGVRQVFRDLPPVPPPLSATSQLQPGDRSIRFDPVP
jgi:predicted proteasome-type protease